MGMSALSVTRCRRPGGSGDVQRGEIPERHRRSDRAARARVGVTHHRRAHVPGRVQASDDAAVVAKGAPVDIRSDATLGAEIAGYHLGRVVGGMADLTEVRIRLVGWISVVVVVGAFAAGVVLIDTRAGEAVEGFDRGHKLT